jgi:hypothetical protein
MVTYCGSNQSYLDRDRDRDRDLQAEDLRKTFPQADVHTVTGVPHGFCLSLAGDERVADFICGIPCIRALLGQAPQMNPYIHQSYYV